MPIVTLHAGALQARIDTRDDDLLRFWFDEWLPRLTFGAAAGTEVEISVGPLIVLGNADWLTDARVLGRRYPIGVTDGHDALSYLAGLRRQLQIEVDELNASTKPPRSPYDH